MTTQPIETVRIKISCRDGTFYASSDDVEGLWLWGKSPAQLFETIGPAIQTLYKHNRGVEVVVKESFRVKISRWLLVRAYRASRPASSEKLERYKIYPISGHVTAVHG
jgi:predicted RNase H-like HicB family nuclease